MKIIGASLVVLIFAGGFIACPVDFPERGFETDRDLALAFVDYLREPGNQRAYLIDNIRETPNFSEIAFNARERLVATLSTLTQSRLDAGLSRTEAAAQDDPDLEIRQAAGILLDLAQPPALLAYYQQQFTTQMESLLTSADWGRIRNVEIKSGSPRSDSGKVKSNETGEDASMTLYSGLEIRLQAMESYDLGRAAAELENRNPVEIAISFDIYMKSMFGFKLLSFSWRILDSGDTDSAENP